MTQIFKVILCYKHTAEICNNNLLRVESLKTSEYKKTFAYYQKHINSTITFSCKLEDDSLKSLYFLNILLSQK